MKVDHGWGALHAMMPKVRTVSLALALTTAATGSASAATAKKANLEPCLQLAEIARQLPAAVWSKGADALAPSLQIKQASAKLTPLESKIAALPAVEERLGNDDGHYPVSVETLPSTSVYIAFDVQGTADCKYLAVVSAVQGRAPRLIASPGPFGEGGLCWTSDGNAGTIFSHPAFVETTGFDVAQTAEDKVKIWPWSGSGWAPACQLTLRYRTVERLSEEFCDDAVACRRVAPLAVAIAEAHRSPRKSGEPFQFGPAAPRGKVAAIARIAAKLGNTGTTEFSTFGADAKTSFSDFSYEDFDLFPLTVDGVTYMAATGYGGVGWRRIGDALLAVYELDEDQPRPVASFVIVRTVIGLSDASVPPEPN